MDYNEKINTLSDEQIEEIGNSLEDIKNNNEELKVLADLPSNNNIEDNINKENGEYRKTLVKINPDTGEHIITGEVIKDDKDKESFDEMNERIANGNINVEIDNSPISLEEINDHIKNSESDSMFKSVFGDAEQPDNETMMAILDVVNRRMNKEEFNVYRAFPDKIKELINSYIAKVNGGCANNSNQHKMIRNMLAESIIDEFITDISIDRVKNDLNKEVEELFEKSSGEIADSIIGYTTERNKQYRDYANSIEDDYKKEKMNKILDQIDEAYNLTGLKEFCKRCKIKHIDLEKCNEKSYTINQFLAKYDESPYNIYSIYIAEQTLLRNLIKKNFNASDKDVRAFFLAFCNQCKNYTPTDSFQHAYMYYVIYNVILSDINTGEKKEVSDLFLDNVIECINNLRARNNNFK